MDLAKITPTSSLTLASTRASRSRFAIALPQFWSDGTFDRTAFTDYLHRAEELGFESVWAQESVLGTQPSLAPLETLSYAAAANTTLRLGCAVFVTTLHSPVHLAKDLASLDQLSGGRLDVGVGMGGPRMFGGFGVDPATTVSRFVEGLELMKACWTRERISFQGRFWQLDGAAMEPKPYQKPYPPIWFGGNHPNAVRRAVAYGSGFMGAGSTTTATFAEQVRVLRAELAAREVTDFSVAKRVYLAVDDDPARARASIKTSLDALYGFFDLGDLTAVAVHGTPDDVVNGLREVGDAGAEMILLHPMTHERDQLERLVAQVLPALG